MQGIGAGSSYVEVKALLVALAPQLEGRRDGGMGGICNALR